MRAGDFSELNRVIYDPITHLPFPGNVIPSSRWDPAAKNILNQLIPESNTAGTRSATGQTINNYLINPTLERQDNQIDLKVDHSLTSNNRFFGRYSYEKTHRVLPATLPHGDAGFTFGAGDGDIKAQGFAFNDTHTFSSNLLNEFRVGWSSIKFFMTPIDYGTNLAQAVGIPGINLGETTSAMSQIMFNNGGMRNLGANANQPLITNQNDIQIFDNVTQGGRQAHDQGRRQLHAPLARDSQRRHDRRTVRLQPEPDVELRRHHQRLHRRREHRLRLRQLPARLREQRQPDAVRSGHLHRAAAGVRRLPPGRHPRDQPADGQRRAALGRVRAVGREGQQAVQLRRLDRPIRGRRPTTRRSTASRSAATCRPTRRPTSDRGSASPTTSTAAARRCVRGGYGLFWNFTPGGTSSSKAQNQPFLQAQATTTNFGTNIILSHGLAGASRRQPDRRTRRVDAVGVPRRSSATRTRTTSTSTCSGRSAPTTCWKRPTRDRGPRTRR